MTDQLPVLRSLPWRIPASDEEQGRCAFLYDPDLPLDVTLIFPAQPGEEPVRWTLARDLLAAGVDAAAGGPAGDGDVRVWATPFHVHMWLRSPDGAAFVEFQRSAVRAFLRATDAAVPFGAEKVWVPDELPAWLFRDAS